MIATEPATLLALIAAFVATTSLILWLAAEDRREDRAVADECERATAHLAHGRWL